MASTAACLIWSGVSKSGSPAPRHRDRSVGPDHEDPRPSEQSVGEQREGNRVKTDDRGDADDAGVGQRGGDEHRPDRRPADQVVTKPLPLVAGQPLSDREPGHDRGLDLATCRLLHME